MLNFTKKNNDNDLYYFFLGVKSHFSADLFAHSGKTKSFLINQGILHHLTELCFCSLFRKNNFIPYRIISIELQQKLIKIGLYPSKLFKFYYLISNILSKFPIWIILPFIIRDHCQKTYSYKELLDNFNSYLNVMFETTNIIFSQNNFTELDTKLISLSKLQSILCK